ncbi:TetR/AcrR family transcriptional regulator, partial [Streptomyces sp. SID11233]|nr:TetR/AcrR family transcriptional regulator [Streptomyces sp. SID11233]
MTEDPYHRPFGEATMAPARTRVLDAALRLMREAGLV